MKKLFLFACISFLFAACTKDDDGGGRNPEETFVTMDFEAATLGAEGYLWGKPLAVTNPDSESLEFSGVIYSEKGASLLSYFSDFGGVWDTWCRFVVSGKHDTVTGTMDNQFSVYTTIDDKQNKFAMAYDMDGMGPGYTFNPVVEFVAAVEVRSVMIANSTWTYRFLTEDTYSDFLVDVIGFNGEKEVGKVRVPLAVDNKLVDNWLKIDLSSLGSVTKLIFAVVCENKQVPTYFCIDDLVYTQPIIPAPKLDVISFEGAEGMLDLKTNKTAVLKDVTMDLYGIGTHTYREVFCAKEYVPAEVAFDALLFTTKDGALRFGSYYANGFDNWGGFALSRNYNKTATALDYKNQFSAWAASGANGTATCMVGYDSSYQPNSYALPVIEFVEPRTVDHLYMTNSTVTYAYSPSASVPAGETYYYKVVITGSLKGVSKGKVECLLVYGDTKVADWTKFSLAMLGEVDKLEFKPASNDANSWGIVVPGYFCIDEIALVKK